MNTQLKTEIVTKDLSKQRLDKFLTLKFTSLSRERIKNLITEGAVLCMNKNTITSPSYKIKEGEFFVLTLPENKPLDVKPENIPLHVLYEDAHLIVINKPADISVHPAGPIVTGTLVNALLYHCKNLSGIGGVERPGIVHRLDKGTSGVMVVAKDDITHQALSDMFKNRTLERYYLALCYGVPLHKKGEIVTQIGRHPKDRKKMAVLEKGGKEAITTYEVLETFNGEASLLKFKLFTGRTHQIRVHAQHIGNSIIADPTYGKPKKLSSSGAKEKINQIQHQMLHATILGFEHPITGEHLYFEEPMPQDMQNLYNVLKN